MLLLNLLEVGRGGMDWWHGIARLQFSVICCVCYTGCCTRWSWVDKFAVLLHGLPGFLSGLVWENSSALGHAFILGINCIFYCLEKKYLRDPV